MQRVILMILMIGCLMGFLSTCVAAEPVDKTPKKVQQHGRLTVLSVNLHVGAGTQAIGEAGVDSKIILENLKRVEKIIAKHDPDIVLLQEVDFYSARTGMINEGEYLAKSLDMHLSSAVTFDTWDSKSDYPKTLKNCKYGVAILSKKKPANTFVLNLPNPPENSDWEVNESRVMLVVNIELADKRIVTIANTHLDYRSRSNRKKQLETMGRILHYDAWILGGDFNEPWPVVDLDANSYRKLAALHGWKSTQNWKYFWPAYLGVSEGTYYGTKATYPVNKPSVDIDHIFAGGFTNLVALKRIDSEGVSDHHFVLAEIKINSAIK